MISYGRTLPLCVQAADELANETGQHCDVIDLRSIFPYDWQAIDQSVQKTKREGKLYAQATLEDATGKIDLIAFPRDYEKLQGQLKIEAPVLIRGTLSGDEDAGTVMPPSKLHSCARL